MKYCSLASVAVAEYIMQSIKRTFLTWAQQAGVGSRDSVAQGHHREPSVSKCVPKYGRAGVLPTIALSACGA